MSELPTHQEINDVAESLRDDMSDESIAATLVHDRNWPALLVRRALIDRYPDVAAVVPVREIDAHRAMLTQMSHRPCVVRHCERLALDWAWRDECEATPYGEADAARLLDEWDAVHFPNQVPEPRRKAALERLRNAGILLEKSE